jgi:predicted nuclease with RNAse H fold
MSIETYPTMSQLGAVIKFTRDAIDNAIEVAAIETYTIDTLIEAYRELVQLSDREAEWYAQEQEEERQKMAKDCGWTDIAHKFARKWE